MDEDAARKVSVRWHEGATTCPDHFIRDPFNDVPSQSALSAYRGNKGNLSGQARPGTDIYACHCTSPILW